MYHTHNNNVQENIIIVSRLRRKHCVQSVGPIMARFVCAFVPRNLVLRHCVVVVLCEYNCLQQQQHLTSDRVGPFGVRPARRLEEK